MCYNFYNFQIQFLNFFQIGGEHMSNPSSLRLEEFQNPKPIDRGTPFWCWNGPLDQEELKKQIETFQTMHMGGAHIHARVGLEDTYLGPRFMDMIRYCNQGIQKTRYAYLAL